MNTKGPTIKELSELVRSASRDKLHLTSRLEKAAFLLLLRHIEALGARHIEALGAHRYRIGSEDGLRRYEVINGHCECSDYVRHGPGHPCKHRLALAFYLRLTGPVSSAVSTNQVPDLTRLSV